jgi:hypothetical protein
MSVLRRARPISLLAVLVVLAAACSGGGDDGGDGDGGDGSGPTAEEEAATVDELVDAFPEAADPDEFEAAFTELVDAVRAEEGLEPLPREPRHDRNARKLANRYLRGTFAYLGMNEGVHELIEEPVVTPLLSQLDGPAPNYSEQLILFDPQHVVAFAGSPVADEYGLAVVRRGPRVLSMAVATGDAPTEDEAAAVTERFVGAVDAQREALGLPALEPDPELDRAATQAARQFFDLTTARFARVGNDLMDSLDDVWLGGEVLGWADPSVGALGPQATVDPEAAVDLVPYADEGGETLGVGFFVRDDRPNWTFVGHPLPRSAQADAEAMVAEEVAAAVNRQREDEGLDAVPVDPALDAEAEAYARTVGAFYAERGDPSDAALTLEGEFDGFVTGAWSGPFRPLPFRSTVTDTQFASNIVAIGTAGFVVPTNGSVIQTVVVLTDGRPSIPARFR